MYIAFLKSRSYIRIVVSAVKNQNHNKHYVYSMVTYFDHFKTVYNQQDAKKPVPTDKYDVCTRMK